MSVGNMQDRHIMVRPALLYLKPVGKNKGRMSGLIH
jgi:hypothetical protein